jgi:hypothetical protein
MKRDMDLCREILRQMAESPDPNSAPVKIEDRALGEVNYHLHIMRHAELIEAIDVSDLQELNYIPLRLTWKGQEFIEAARNDTVWRKAKGRLIDAAGGLTFDLLLAALKAEIRSQTGLDL